jgi:hypothetical protein
MHKSGISYVIFLLDYECLKPTFLCAFESTDLTVDCYSYDNIGLYTSYVEAAIWWH